MANEAKERNYSDDEIEEILGVGGYEAKLMLREIRDTIQDNPLLVAALVFAMGVLVGASLTRGHRKS
jgi:aldehyde:ferredoxin oxidoreductase